jgi:hypothetical protein
LYPCYTNPLYLSGNGTLVGLNGAVSATSGIDISGGTFTASAFKSPGFSIGGGGNVTANQLYISKTITFTNDTFSIANGKASIGTLTTVNGTCNDPSTCYASNYQLNNQLDASAAPNGFFGVRWLMGENGASQKGTTVTGDFENGITVTPAGLNENVVGLQTVASSSVNMNGTSGAYAGSIFGLNVLTKLEGTASFIGQEIGMEIDAYAKTGATYQDLILTQLVLTPPHAVKGSRMNVGLVFGAATATTAKLDALVEDGTYSGYTALDTTGSVFRCYPNSNTGNCGTITNGIDLSRYTSITGSAFKSPGFSVDGSGNAIVRLITTSGFTVATLPAAGTAGRSAFVTDQLTSCPAVGGALTGGGAVKCPVFDNGTAWVSG